MADEAIKNDGLLDSIIRGAMSEAVAAYIERSGHKRYGPLHKPTNVCQIKGLRLGDRLYYCHGCDDGVYAVLNEYLVVGHDEGGCPIVIQMPFANESGPDYATDEMSRTRDEAILRAVESDIELWSELLAKAEAMKKKLAKKADSK